MSKRKPGVVRYRTGKTWTPAELIRESSGPRSYTIRSPAGNLIVRNRRHILDTREPTTPLTSAQLDHQINEDYINNQTANDVPQPIQQPMRIQSLMSNTRYQWKEHI